MQDKVRSCDAAHVMSCRPTNILPRRSELPLYHVWQHFVWWDINPGKNKSKKNSNFFLCSSMDLFRANPFEWWPRGAQNIYGQHMVINFDRDINAEASSPHPPAGKTKREGGRKKKKKKKKTGRFGINSCERKSLIFHLLLLFTFTFAFTFAFAFCVN